MTTEKFWKLIEKAKEKSDDSEQQIEILGESLRDVCLEDLVDFDFILNMLMARAYHWDLWGAAAIINGSSDDGFQYFRGWLILQGEKIFEAALSDPESLVTVAEAEVENEEINYLAVQVYTTRTGKEFPRRKVEGEFELKGARWAEEELARKYPKLTQKFR